jgi:hypothetical protein
LQQNYRSADVAPVFEKGRIQEVNDSRPVDLASARSKIMDMILRDNLLVYFVENTLFTDTQYGLSARRSTVLQSLKVKDM